ncbi:MAG: CcoQ/FixQ family Cbb3-type cytochrome c oxidase assembly chaperone [Gammaproteobacteria bacterium]|nr:CcoQ/FixQ family Cbb3-type cytochrome c oxidase assembly chaperone [Gammaproteobacteria bacterium]
MSPVWGHAIGIFIVLMMAAFIALWAWVWLPCHGRTYGALARLPMEDHAAPAAGSAPADGEETQR